MKRWIIVALGVALVIGGWILLRGDPDIRAIRKAFAELTEAAQWEQRDDILRAGLTARRILGHCTPDIVFDVDDLPYRFSNRGELQAAILHARTTVNRLSIDVIDQDIVLGPDRTAAEMFVTARITVRYVRETNSDLRSVKLQWVKTEDGWRLAQVESLETIDSG